MLAPGAPRATSRSRSCVPLLAVHSACRIHQSGSSPATPPPPASAPRPPTPRAPPPRLPRRAAILPRERPDPQTPCGAHQRRPRPHAIVPDDDQGGRALSQPFLERHHLVPHAMAAPPPPPPPPPP